MFYLAKPRILNISKTATHQINNNVTLTCDVSGDPQPTISWRIENSSHPLSSKKFQLSNSNQTLLIRNISLNDENTYICEAQNKYASVERNVTINVKGLMIKQNFVIVRNLNTALNGCVFAMLNL